MYSCGFPVVSSLQQVVEALPKEPRTLVCIDIDETLIPTPENFDHQPDLLDPETPKHIDTLKKTHTYVIAFTAAQGRDTRMAPEDFVPDWRHRHLTALGLTFHSADVHVLSQHPFKGSQAIFKNGILFSDQRDKGEILQEFLSATRWKVSRIVLVDDSWINLVSVRRAAQKMELPFQGFLFQRGELSIDRHESRLPPTRALDEIALPQEPPEH